MIEQALVIYSNAGAIIEAFFKTIIVHMLVSIFHNYLPIPG